MFVIVILFAVLFTAIFSGYIIYKKYERVIILSRNFNGPPPLPIIGNALMLVGKNPEEYIKIIDRCIVQYGDTIKLWIGPEFHLMLCDLNDVEKILNSSKFIEKASEYDVLHPWLNEGLLVSKGRKWFKRRKIVTPAFHFKILEQYIEVFDQQSNILIEKLKKFNENDEIDFYPFITLCALDIICKTAMGVTANAQHNSESEYVKAVQSISKILHKRMFDVMYRYDFIFNLMPLAWEQKRALKIMHDFSEKIIISRREEIVQQNEKIETNNNNDDDGIKKKIAFLDILLQSKIDGKPLSNLDIREEVDTFMFEGHDTTASAIHFCLYNLACYPDAQEKCFQEICTVIGKDKTKPITYNNLNDLHYLELCCKETLRLFPSVPLIGRKVNQECVINGKTIPAGTGIGICPYELGRFEHLFPNALKFIPERHDIETSAEKRNPYGFIPFSAGPRNCIGQKFAILEMKSVISKVLRNFEIEFLGPPEGPILVAELILRCTNILKFKIKPRLYAKLD